MRISADGGRSYPRSRERQLPLTPPGQPAAVRIYDANGAARCLPADLDVSRGGPEQVARDLTRLHSLITSCGGNAIVDRSPNGGVHLYVPWQQPVPFTEVRPVMLALAELLPTLDVQPAVNLLSGCLRPPGSRHKSGGWQELVTPLAEARRTAAAGNPPHVWARLRAALMPQLLGAQPERSVAANQPTTATVTTALRRKHVGSSRTDGVAGPHELRAHQERLAVPRRRSLTAATLKLAQRGDYDTSRYATPSQARQRVVAAVAGAGWSYAELQTELQSGTWPGLASFYNRYRPHHRAERLAADWNGAVTWLRQQAPFPQAKVGVTHNSHTRAPTTHRGVEQGQSEPASSSQRVNSPADRGRGSSAEYQFIRSWWNAARRLERARYAGRGGLTRRLLLRALVNAAQKKGSRYLEFGCRSLSLAMGVDYSTVAAALRALRSEEDPLLVLLDSRRGVRGDLYELTIPNDVADSIERRPWQAGKIEAIHPAFRVLGLPVAFVYEQLRASGRSSFDLADQALVSHRAAQEGLKTLGAHGLATRTPAGWVRGRRSLDSVADELGVPETIVRLRALYEEQRYVWRALLGAVLPPAEIDLEPDVPTPHDTREFGPSGTTATLTDLSASLDVLQGILGAVVIHTGDNATRAESGQGPPNDPPERADHTATPRPTTAQVGDARPRDCRRRLKIEQSATAES